MTARRIAHFELGELLGEGAMGRVYRAMDLQLDRLVAIKLLGARTAGDPAFFDRFKREARLAAQLNHPHIATIYAYGEEAGEAYIAMEFVEGETLSTLLERGPLPIPLVRKYGRQAAAALAVAHEKGIVHRDIKPANLMVNRHGDVKVMDFGVARRSGETELTMAGSLIGTANIMAPELVRGEAATPAADLFSLGCVLYEMLAGRPTFEGETAMAVLFQVTQAEPPPLETLRPDSPPDLVEVVQGLLVKDPASRLGPASLVAERLGGEGASFSPGKTMTLSPERTMVLPSGTSFGKEPPAVRKRDLGLRPFVGAGVVLIVLVAGGLIFFKARKEARVLALVTRGEELAADRDSLEQALAQFEEARDLDPKHARVRNDLGLVYAGLKRRNDAKAELLEAMKLDRNYANPRYNLAQIYGKEDVDSAEVLYREAIALDQNYAEAYAGLARLLEEEGMTGEAIATYLNAIQANPQYYLYNEIGVLLIREGRAPEAERYLLEGTQKFPSIKNLWKNLADAYRAQEKWEEAQANYSRALGIDSTYVDAKVGLALVAEAMGNIEKARALWLDLRGKSPELEHQAVDALKRLEGRP